MRPVLLIAWREYKQYIFSRGFLLFLIMFPIGMVFAGGALGLLEKNRPTRHFVVYDETGAYTDDIDQAIERRHLFAAIGAWDMYAAVNKSPDAPEHALPEPFSPGPDNAPLDDRRAQKFMAAGGFDAAEAALMPYLKPGARPFTKPRDAFRRLPLPGDAANAASIEDVEAAMRPYLLGEKQARGPDGEPTQIFAAVLIPKGFNASEEAEPAQYWSRNLTDTALQNQIDYALDTALRRETITNYGLSDEALQEVIAINAPVSAFRPDKAPDEAELGMADRIETALPAVMTYMLVVIIFGVGNLLLTNTIEERSNKIVEILLSSVTANQLMMGKLLGIAAVGLTMPSIFLLGGVAIALASGAQDNVAAIGVMALFSSNLLLIYLFYFFCAYLIFAMIFLAIGAVSNSLQDAQSYMGPVMLLVFAPLPFMLMVFQNPNGLIASVLTWIPIYTPYAVMLRAAADPPLWEVVGATALMLAFTIFLMRIMGRIFRQAILQAAPPKAKEVWRLAKGEAG